MKKIIDFAIIALLSVAAAGFIAHFEIKSELITLFKSVAHKLVPWVNNIVYS